MAELFYSKNGVPIEEDNTYDYESRFKLRTATSDENLFVEAGQQTVGLHFDREYRFYSSLSFDRGSWFDNGKKGNEAWYIHSRQGDFASIFERSQFSVTGYWAKKLVNLKNQIKDGNYYVVKSYAFPIIRLADLYLYYAEALNETKDAPDANVYEYIDKVRERAGLKGVKESWANFSKNPGKPNTKAGMREIIQQERLIELAFEGARFWDLRRWKLAVQYMNRPIRGWNVFKSEAKDYYNVQNIYNQRFTQRDYLWPIAEDVIVKNPNIVQNPGW